jgi:hypothetical protein
MVSLSPEGRGRGEGVRKLQNNLHRPNPLNLSFFPLGRRDAARRLRLNLIAQKASSGHGIFGRTARISLRSSGLLAEKPPGV